MIIVDRASATGQGGVVFIEGQGVVMERVCAAQAGNAAFMWVCTSGRF